LSIFKTWSCRLAGLDRVDSLNESYLRGAAGYLLVADGTRSATLSTAIELQAAVEQVLGGVPFACLLNKSDLEDEWELADAEAERTGTRVVHNLDDLVDLMA
jgi:hypothetical protein